MLQCQEFFLQKIRYLDKLPPELSSDYLTNLFRKCLGSVSLSLGLFRVPDVCLMSHSSVVTMSQKHSLIKLPYLAP